MAIIIKSNRELASMRIAGNIVAKTLTELKNAIRPNVTTLDLDILATKMIKDMGGIPSFKGYRGYPANICTSINEEVVHGIPNKKRSLKEGDIISIDLGVIINNYHADAAITIPVGKVSPLIQKLLNVAENALWKGIEKAKYGNRLGDISYAIQLEAELNNFFVVKDYVGHGVGRNLHEDPQIPNYGTPHTGPILQKCMTLALEPMVNTGTSKVKLKNNDKWTVVTADGSYSAHFEHSIIITENAAEILTVQT